MLKVLSDCNIRYTLFDWLKYHAPPSNQSNAKLTGIATWLPAFSRAGHKSRVLTLNSHWFLRILPFPQSWPFVITLVFPFRSAISKIALVEFYPLVKEIIPKRLSIRYEERYVQCSSKTYLKPCVRKK